MSVVLVDTSVWIHWLKTRPNKLLTDSQLSRTVVCPPIVQEILQGLRISKESRAFRECFMELPCLCKEVDLSLFVEAADLYAITRAKGHTVRSSVDCLIAAIAIREKVPVMHRDRDYDAISRVSALEVVNSID